MYLIVLVLVFQMAALFVIKPASASGLAFVCASSTAGTSTGACTGEAAGNLLLIMCGETTGGAAPALPSGVTAVSGSSLTNSAGSTSTRTGMQVGWTTAANSSSGSGTCGSGTTDTVMMVYSGQSSSSPIGANLGTESGSNSGTSVSFNSDTLSVTDGSSWFAAFAIRNTAHANMGTAPSGMTNRTKVPTGTPAAAGHDTNGGTASNWSLTSVTGFSSSAKYTSVVLEIEAAANSAPNAPSLSAPASGATGISTTPTFTLSTTDPDGDAVKYRIYLYQSDCSTPVGASPFAQASSGTGWDNGTTAYASGTTANYTYQSTLSNSTTYCWKADAIDPSGSNTYGSASSTQSFTTAASGPTTDQELRGGEYFTGGTKQPYYWAQ